MEPARVKVTVYTRLDHELVPQALHIDPGATAAAVASLCVEQSNVVSSHPNTSWRLAEVFDVPPIERWLHPQEVVQDIRASWPEHMHVTCRLELREGATQLEAAAPAPTAMRGPLDKRGGSHKSWHTRFFLLSTAEMNLSYYKTEPSGIRELDNQKGQWSCRNVLVYTIRDLKKAPRPKLCFCLKPITTPLWPASVKEVLEHFEEQCRFMCAANSEERTQWVAAITELALQSADSVAPVPLYDERGRLAARPVSLASSVASARLSTSSGQDSGIANVFGNPLLPLEPETRLGPSGSILSIYSTRDQGSDTNSILPDTNQGIHALYGDSDSDAVHSNVGSTAHVAHNGPRPLPPLPTKATAPPADGDLVIPSMSKPSFRRPTCVRHVPEPLQLAGDPREWDNSDIHRWLKEEGLEQFQSFFYKSGFVGRQLLAFQAMSCQQYGHSSDECASLGDAIESLRTRAFVGQAANTEVQPADGGSAAAAADEGASQLDIYTFQTPSNEVAPSVVVASSRASDTQPPRDASGPTPARPKPQPKPRPNHGLSTTVAMLPPSQDEYAHLPAARTVAAAAKVPPPRPLRKPRAGTAPELQIPDFLATDQARRHSSAVVAALGVYALPGSELQPIDRAEGPGPSANAQEMDAQYTAFGMEGQAMVPLSPHSTTPGWLPTVAEQEPLPDADLTLDYGAPLSNAPSHGHGLATAPSSTPLAPGYSILTTSKGRLDPAGAEALSEPFLDHFYDYPVVPDTNMNGGGQGEYACAYEVMTDADPTQTPRPHTQSKPVTVLHRRSTAELRAAQHVLESQHTSLPPGALYDDLKAEYGSSNRPQSEAAELVYGEAAEAAESIRGDVAEPVYAEAVDEPTLINSTRANVMEQAFPLYGVPVDVRGPTAVEPRGMSSPLYASPLAVPEPAAVKPAQCSSPLYAVPLDVQREGLPVLPSASEPVAAPQGSEDHPSHVPVVLYLEDLENQYANFAAIQQHYQHLLSEEEEDEEDEGSGAPTVVDASEA